MEHDPRLGQLTYCMNVHAGDDWPALRDALSGPARAVKDAVSPAAPFPLGLRVSASALGTLAEPETRAELRALIDPATFRALTVNGLPGRHFNGAAVKEDVFQPDWLSDARFDYTCALADLMADLSSPGDTVSLSTVPGAFRPYGLGRESEIAARLVRAAAHCVKIRRRTGVTIALALEPEPCCLLETVEDSIAFFDTHLYSRKAEAMLAQLTGLSGCGAAMALRRHLGLCYDVCHAAVAFEDAAGSIAALRAAGLPVHKLQLSSALRVPSVDAAARAALAPFAESVYLHQVVSRRGDGPLGHEHDLPEALARGGAADGEAWRIHLHVPVFLDRVPPFETTQDFLKQILALHRVEPIAPHLEIETYTWEMLPEGLRTATLTDAVARELQWVSERLSP